MRPQTFETGAECARALDAEDPLARFRRCFELPKDRRGKPLHYLCGHSLGLMPRRARALLERELERWASQGVEGHDDADGGWLHYHERFSRPLAELIGAAPEEVVAMNSLTVNLHLMLVSFFQPTPVRYKILLERQAFPSDRYAVISQLRYHGLDPQQALIELGALERPGTLCPAELETTLEAQGERVALVLLPGVQYLSGQVLDVAALGRIARRFGCRVGLDLAHAIGNVPLDLQRAAPDFAVWCSYKYLNGGPGAIGGCFVHRRWAKERGLPRFAGWWGHDKKRRFFMERTFAAMPGAEGWQISNPPIFAMTPLSASLALFERAGLEALRAKSERLTAYLQYLLETELGDRVSILTPPAPQARGCQLSVRITASERRKSEIPALLRAAGVVADWRPPDILRVAAVPLYNRFLDVQQTVRALKRALG